jgi:hypothetical protein
MAAAAAGSAALRRERTPELVDRSARRPVQWDRPAPLSAPRGVALAVALGAVLWIVGVAAVFIF